MNRFAILVSTLLLSTSAFAINAEVQTVKVSSNETLKSMVDSEEWGGVVSLRIKGELSAADFDFIRSTNIQNLDLSGIDNKVLPAKAFYGCVNLKSVVLPDDMLSLGIASFMHCTELETIHLPKKLKEIHSLVFSECASLKSIDLSKSVNSINAGAFYACSNLVGIQVESGNVHYKSVDGIVYSTDGALVACPAGKHGNIVVQENTATIEKGAFGGCTFITNVELPNTIKKVADGAFWNCKALNSLTLPDSVEVIGNGVFLGAGLTSFSWPAAIASIPSETFKDCGKLKSFSVPKGVLTIGNGTFQGCGQLEDLKLPNTLTEIGDRAFQGCASIKSIVLPDNLLKIGNEAFASCFLLEKINIPNEIAVLENGLFAQCSSLRTFVVPYTIKKIENRVFQGCGKLKTIDLPLSLLCLGDAAFADCNSLNGIIIPSSVQTIGRSVFKNCKSLEFARLSSQLTEIAEEAFMNCEQLKNIDIPTSVSGINDNAFRGCLSLSSVSFPEQLLILGSGAFAGCDNIKSILCQSDMPARMGVSVFSEKVENTTLLYVPNESVQKYKKSSSWSHFTNMQSNFVLTVTKPGFMSFMIPDSLWTSLQNISIEGDLNTKDVAFLSNLLRRGSCLKVLNLQNAVYKEEFSLNTNVKPSNNQANSSLRIVYLPKDTKRIGNYGFADLLGLESVVCSDELESIGKYAFANCSSIAAFNIPNGVKSVGIGAFVNCKSLSSIGSTSALFKSVNGVLYSHDMKDLLVYPCGKKDEKFAVPNGVQTIREAACAHACFNELVIPNSVVEIKDSAFACCNNLTSVSIPGNVEIIGNSAFLKDSSLNLILLEEGVKAVGISAFQDCKNLEAVDMASSVSNIGDYAFWGCSNLTTFTNRANTPQNSKPNIFGKVLSSSTASLYVNESARTSYRKSATWSKFSIVESLAE